MPWGARKCAVALVGLASVQAWQAGALSRLPSVRGRCCVLSHSLCMSDGTRNDESAPAEQGWWNLNQLSRALFPSPEERRKAEVEMRRRREGQRKPKPISVQAQVSSALRACMLCDIALPDSSVASSAAG
jgi:hypothetical protein